MRYINRLKLNEDEDFDDYVIQTDEEKWNEIKRHYNDIKNGWNAAAFGYLTFDKFLQYYYHPPGRKK
jgi:hypothetical protein